jgi:hypothetical protein
MMSLTAGVAYGVPVTQTDAAQNVSPIDNRRIFVSYRRDDTAGYAGRLHDSLLDRRKAWDVFIDIDSIAPGRQFDRVIEEAVGRSDAMLVLIGPSWIGSGLSRLFDPDDFVRREIVAGLAAEIPVVPILLRDAVLPSPTALPEDLLPLLRRQAFRLRDQTWRTDIDALVLSLETLTQHREPADTSRPVRDGRPKVHATGALPVQRTGDAARAARCVVGSLAWFGAAALTASQIGGSVELLGGAAGALNVFLATASLMTPLPHSVRWPIVLGAAVVLGTLWRTVTGYFGLDNGALCAALLSGFVTVPWQPIRLRSVAFRLPHRGWRCTVGALAWLVAAVVGYFATESFTSKVAPLWMAGAFGGAVNGFLIGRVAENGRWSSRTPLWTAALSLGGAATWFALGTVYPEPFVPAPLITGLITGIVLALPLPVAEGNAIGSTWRGVVGSSAFGVIGLLLALSGHLLPSDSEPSAAVVGTGLLVGGANGLLIKARAWSTRMTWVTGCGLVCGIGWGGLQLAYPESYIVLAIIGSAAGAFILHQVAGHR